MALRNLRGHLARQLAQSSSRGGLDVLDEVDVPTIREWQEFSAEAVQGPMDLARVLPHVLELRAHAHGGDGDEHEDACCTWTQAWHAWALVLLDRLQADLRHSSSSALDTALGYCLTHPALALGAASVMCRSPDPSVVGIFLTVTSLASWWSSQSVAEKVVGSGRSKELGNLLSAWLRELTQRPAEMGRDEALWWATCVKEVGMLFKSFSEADEGCLKDAAWADLASPLLRACAWTDALRLLLSSADPCEHDAAKSASLICLAMEGVVAEIANQDREAPMFILKDTCCLRGLLALLNATLKWQELAFGDDPFWEDFMPSTDDWASLAKMLRTGIANQLVRADFLRLGGMMAIGDSLFALQQAQTTSNPGHEKVEDLQYACSLMLAVAIDCILIEDGDADADVDFSKSASHHLNDWRPPPGPAGAGFDSRTQGCSGVLKLTLAVLEQLPDNEELCDSFTPYPWLVARSTLSLLEAMLLSRHSPREALVADFARLDGVPAVLKKLATRRAPPEKPCKAWRMGLMTQDAASLLAAACGPWPHHEVVAALTREGKWMSEGETGWEIWRARYADLLVDRQLGIAALIEKLQWAAPARNDSAVIVRLAETRSFHGGFLTLARLLLEQRADQRAALCAHPTWMATLIKVDPQERKSDVLASLAALAWHEPSSQGLLCKKGALKVMETALNSAWRGSPPGKDDAGVQRAHRMLAWVQRVPGFTAAEEGLSLTRAQEGARQAVAADLAWAYRLLFALTGPDETKDGAVQDSGAHSFACVQVACICLRSYYQLTDGFSSDYLHSVCEEHRPHIALVAQQMAVCRRKVVQHRDLEAQRQREDWKRADLVAAELLAEEAAAQAKGQEEKSKKGAKKQRQKERQQAERAAAEAAVAEKAAAKRQAAELEAAEKKAARQRAAAEKVAAKAQAAVVAAAALAEAEAAVAAAEAAEAKAAAAEAAKAARAAGAAEERRAQAAAAAAEDERRQREAAQRAAAKEDWRAAQAEPPQPELSPEEDELQALLADLLPGLGPASAAPAPAPPPAVEAVWGGNALLRAALQCPLTGQLMQDPVIIADGHSYERGAIESWLAAQGTSPLTGEALVPAGVVRPNRVLRQVLETML